MSEVRLEGVSRHFGAVKAVDGVDIHVKSGEFVTLLGPSGCGKTTTLRMIAGLERNTGGVIRLAGEVVSDAAAGQFVLPEQRNLGMVFQSYAIWPHMSVFENVAYPLRIRKQSRDQIERKVVEVLNLVEMGELADRDSTTLSGGQQQRVAIARALVAEPTVLLLDEPLSNLDAKLRTQMGDEFRSLQERLNITTVYVTHDQLEAMALSDRIVVMQDGKVLQEGDAEQIYHRPNSIDVAKFIGAPNLLSARVLDSSGTPEEGFVASVEGQGWSGRCEAGTKLAPGQAAIVMIRPENLRLANSLSAPAPGAISLSACVESSIFRGASRTVTAGTSAGPVTFDASSLERVNSGATITLTVPAGGAWAMPLA